MTGRLIVFALFCAAIAAPAFAAQEQVTLSVAARTVGDSVARRPVGPDGEQADKLIAFIVKDGELGLGPTVLLEQDTIAEPVVAEGTVALLRTRPAIRRPRSEPDAIDIALARSVSIPVYIVSEWRKPPVIWEVAVSGDAVNWRTIDESGLAGPWYEIIE